MYLISTCRYPHIKWSYRELSEQYQATTSYPGLTPRLNRDRGAGGDLVHDSIDYCPFCRLATSLAILQHFFLKHILGTTICNFHYFSLDWGDFVSLCLT